MLFLATATRACIIPSPTPPRPPAPRLPPLVPFNHRRRRRPVKPLLRPVTRAARRPPPPPAPSSRPARDRVIEFGKHRGQMLGTLPPPYLRWVAAELDYGETAPWAALAREVLDDPVYLDRAEWDHAHRFLRGDSEFDYAYDDGGDGPLKEMAERFGWDLSDEEGWARLDLRLLGTSFGGRIPRKGARSQSNGGGGRTASSPATGRKEGSLFDDAAAGPDGPKGKRDERRERMRMRREEQVRTAKMGVLGVNAAADGSALGTPRKARIKAAKKEILGLGRGTGRGELLGEKRTAGKGGQGGSPFPGRQAFLDKVRKLKGDDDDS